MIDVKKVEDFEKLTTSLDGIATAIQNMPAPSGGELVYDNTEKKVGTWFGKDLYSKSFDLRTTSLSYGHWNENLLSTINSGITIVSFDGFCVSSDDGAYIPLNFYRADSNFVFTECNNTNDDISIYNYITSSVHLNAGFITIWYIKESW